MHELDLMQRVIEILRENAAARGITRIYRVRLIVGKFTAALPDALQFAFATLACEPLFEQAALDIEEREMVGRCAHCRRNFTVENYRFVCPGCGQSCVDLISGRELYVESYEGE